MWPGILVLNFASNSCTLIFKDYSISIHSIQLCRLSLFYVLFCFRTRGRSHNHHTTPTKTTTQERGELLLLRYAARWGKEVMRGQAEVNIAEPARHCAPFTCPCQYIERHLKCKPRGKSKYFIVCDGLLAAERCDSFYFIFFSIFLILGVYAMYMVNYRSQV